MTKPVPESKIVEQLVSKLRLDYRISILTRQSHSLEKLPMPASPGEIFPIHVLRNDREYPFHTIVERV